MRRFRRSGVLNERPGNDLAPYALSLCVILVRSIDYVAAVKNYEDVERQHMKHAIRGAPWFWLAVAMVILLLI